MCNSEKCSFKIMSLLKNIQNALNCNVTSNAENLGLTVSQLMVVYEIYNNKYISLNDLSRRLDLPKSSVSRIVDQLVNMGAVNREIPKENRRIVKLSIVAKFLENEKISNINEKIKGAIIDEIEPKKSERIISALEELSSFLKCDKKK